jgi:hypothetical protein
MASDNLKQVGQFIKNTRKGVDHALKRYHGDIPKVERTRDIFDSEIPFEMNFSTEKPGERVLLNLNFNKPPPMNDCVADCLEARCESFTLQPGNHIVQLAQGYTAGTITVFVDAVPVLDSDFDEVDPANGTVYIQSESLDTYVATVCYTFGTCVGDDEGCIDYPSPGGYTGLAVIFADRFDKSFVEVEPRCGQWGLDDSPTITLNGDGTANINETIYLENETMVGPQWEVLVRFRFPATFSTSVFRLEASSGGNGFNSFLTIGPWGQGAVASRAITLSGRYEGLDPTSTGLAWTETGATTSTTYKEFPTDETQEYYVRYVQYVGVGWFAKIWNVTEEEPAAWTASLWAIPAPVNPAVTRQEWVSHNLQKLLVTSTAVRHITVWGQGSVGRWVGFSSGTTWAYDDCYPNPDGLIRFGHCDEFSQTISGPTNQGSHSSDVLTPSALVSYSSPIFATGPNAKTGTSQGMVSFSVPEGCTSVILECEYRMTGNSAWNGFGSTATIYQYDFGTTPPSPGPGRLPGSSVTSFSGPVNGPGWLPLTFSITPINNQVQWGFMVVTDASGWPPAESGFLFPPNGGLSVQFRQKRTFALGVMHCTTRPGCPVDEQDIFSNCGDSYDSLLNATNYDFYCGVTVNTPTNDIFRYYTNDSGSRTRMRSQIGTAVTSTSDGARISWRARGRTFDGSDGRCRKALSGTSFDDSTRGTSSTTAAVTFNFTSPVVCEGGALSQFEFKLNSMPQSQWTTTGNTLTTPAFELTFGDDPITFTSFILERAVNGSFISTNGMGPFLSDATFSGGLDIGDWYSVKYLADGSNVKMKIWKSSGSEPGSWYHEALIAEANQGGFTISLSYSNFSEDGFSVDVRNVSSVRP